MKLAEAIAEGLRILSRFVDRETLTCGQAVGIESLRELAAQIESEGIDEFNNPEGKGKGKDDEKV